MGSSLFSFFLRIDMIEGAELGDMFGSMVLLLVELLSCFSIGNFEGILMSRDYSDVSFSSSGEKLRRFFMVDER